VGRLRALAFPRWNASSERFTLTGLSLREALGERLWAAPDFTGDGVSDLLTTHRPIRLVGDRTSLLINGATGQRVGSAQVTYNSQGTFAEAAAWGARDAAGALLYALGAPGTTLRFTDGTQQLGGGLVYLMNEDGVIESSFYDAVDPEDAVGFGQGVAVIPSARGALVFVGAREGGALRMLNEPLGALSTPATGTDGLGVGLAASTAPAADGAYRLFVGEPRVNGDRGRVRVFAVR